MAMFNHMEVIFCALLGNKKASRSMPANLIFEEVIFKFYNILMESLYPAGVRIITRTNSGLYVNLTINSVLLTVKML